MPSILISAFVVSLLGATAMFLLARTLGIHARLIFGIGPRIGAKDGEPPKVQLRPFPFWCWTQLVDAHGVRALLVRAAAPITMLLVPFAIATLLVYSVPIREPDLRGPAIVEELRPGAPAEVAGIQVGDTIVSVDDEAISDFGSLSTAVGSRPGRETRLGIDRAGLRLERIVTPVDLDGLGRIGVSSRMRERPRGLGDAVTYVMSHLARVGTFWSRELAGAQDDTVVGPVGIVRTTERGTPEPRSMRLVAAMLAIAWTAASIVWAAIAAVQQSVTALYAAITSRRRSPRAA